MEILVDIIFFLFIVLISILLLFSIVVFVMIPKLRTKKQAIISEINSEDGFDNKKYNKKSIYRFGKRVTDIVASLIALIIGMPIMLVVAVILALSKEKVFKKKTVIGNKGKKVKLYQFNVNPNSKRILRGVRATGFDMWPKYINILKGDMSLIGISVYGTESNEELVKMLDYEKPGMTSLASICPRAFLDREKYNKYYVANRGVMMDIFILMSTCMLVFNDFE